MVTRLGQLTTAVLLAVDRLVHHARAPSKRKPAAPKAGPLAVCERFPHDTCVKWARIIRLLENRGYRVHQADRFSVANPLVAACRDWRELLGRELLGAELLVVDTTGPETSCGAAVLIGGAAALGRRIIAWHPTPSWTFAEGREANWRNPMIQYSIHARTPDGINLAERYQRILSRTGRLALDRSFISELVYGPLHHGGSRLTDADACDLAALVARREGVLAHLTAPASVIRARLLARDGPAAASPADIEFLLRAYERVVTTLAPYLPVVRLDTR